MARVFDNDFSGFLAWWLWRTIYLSKLPRLEKKIRVAIDWTLDLIFAKAFVHFLPERARPATMMPADKADAGRLPIPEHHVHPSALRQTRAAEERAS